MARAKKHKDVEFAVDDAGGKERIFKTFDEAAGFAVVLALSDGREKHIDVLIYSHAGARWYGGDDFADSWYDEDSVSDRIHIRAESYGAVA